MDRKVQEDRIIRRGGKKNTLFNILKLSQEIGKIVCEVIWEKISIKLKLEEEISIN